MAQPEALPPVAFVVPLVVLDLVALVHYPVVVLVLVLVVQVARQLVELAFVDRPS